MPRHQHQRLVQPPTPPHRSRITVHGSHRQRSCSLSSTASTLPPSSPEQELTGIQEIQQPDPGAPLSDPSQPFPFHMELCVDSRVDGGAEKDTLPCPGVLIHWDAGSIWETYPYAFHTTKASGWVPISYGENENSIQLRSNKCKHPVGGSSGHTCIACQTLRYSHEFRTFVEHATEAKPKTPWDYLSHKQQRQLMKKMRAQLVQLRTQLANAKRSLATAKHRIADYQRIMMMLATNDFVSLQKLLSVSLRHGSSPAAIVTQLQRALDGLYNPWSGFTDIELDVTFIAKALGGQRLLYALQKSHGLPSYRTVQRHSPIHRLVVSIGKPSEHEFNTNIHAFLNPDIKPKPNSFKTPIGKSIIPGNVLMFDGIALEGRCRYCPKRDQVMGFCREHSQHLSMTCDSVETIEGYRDLVDKGKLCYGSEATCVAIAPYAQSDHYTPVPLVLSPSETEKGAELKTWIQDLLHSWESHEYGAASHGPIWALASDGDSSYRLAKHLLCMTTKLDDSSPLGQKLGKYHYTGQV